MPKKNGTVFDFAKANQELLREFLLRKAGKRVCPLTRENLEAFDQFTDSESVDSRVSSSRDNVSVDRDVPVYMQYAVTLDDIRKSKLMEFKSDGVNSKYLDIKAMNEELHSLSLTSNRTDASHLSHVSLEDSMDYDNIGYKSSEINVTETSSCCKSTDIETTDIETTKQAVIIAKPVLTETTEPTVIVAKQVQTETTEPAVVDAEPVQTVWRLEGDHVIQVGFVYKYW